MRRMVVARNKKKVPAIRPATLFKMAREVAKHSHSPYSQFRVGAVVVAGGKIFKGTNVENASYGLTLCAERSALSAAVAAGAGKVTQIALSCVDADQNLGIEQRMPCGACRQWMQELAPDAVLLIDMIERQFKVEELLPYGFKF